MSKLDQLRAMREARADRSTRDKVTNVTEYVFPYSRAELEAEYPGITAPDRDPTLPRTGRPRVHASGAAKQRAYRARKKAPQ